jgi:hypothetical protein
MKMTKKRKSLQDKLRRKFGWKTAHQGATLKDVNKALDELNKCADLTIYNFTEMAKNIGAFADSGRKGEET